MDSKEIAEQDLKKFNWSYTADEINTITANFISNQETIVNEILSVKDEECSFENVIFPLVRKLEDETDFLKSAMTFLQNVSTDKSVRAASSNAEYSLSSVNYLNNPAVLQKISKAIENIDNGKVATPVHPEDLRIIDTFHKAALNLNLDPEVSNKINELEMKIIENADSIMDCIYDGQETDSVVFTKSELVGVSDSVIKALQPTTKDGEEAYIALPKASIYSAILTTAKNENTRKAIMTLYQQRCKPNVELLKETVNMQLEIAHINGYSSHAEHILESKMAKNSKNVFNFLDSLKEKLLPGTQSDIEKLLEVKKAEKAELNEPFDNTIHLYDLEYYRKILNQKEYTLNNALVSEYFPVVDVVNEMLQIYEEIFSLKIEEVPNPQTWHPDVRQFLVFDQSTNTYMGSFYVDLFSRDGKVTYSASFHLGYGYEKEDGTRGYPAAALVTSFSKPNSDEPVLLTHYDVTIVFHELGHIFHEIISETKYTRFNGYNVEQDFLETPSQMLEYFCWEPEVIERLSKHYKDGSKMPADLIQAIVKSKNVNNGIYYNNNLLFKSYVDMRLYSIEKEDPNLDPIKVWDDTRKEITLVESVENTWPIAVFDHIVDGYDAGYYGYLWSQVYAADIFFSQFKKNGIFNPETGSRYRNIILKSGSTRDAMEILKEFLGREPSDDAFISSIGVN
ncbi:hypothetical protein PIROE2DRAFT_45620 [Piromyces sp. E2]|nr:hypothetical protein PIROE2DRAFT_45620 [Piromyces sp. E2]|eukprot:OUM61065.1 hypothetical protein PIROE2DRAFT_45620 [Piromyces sp. E2]